MPLFAAYSTSSGDCWGCVRAATIEAATKEMQEACAPRQEWTPIDERSSRFSLTPASITVYIVLVDMAP